MKTRTKSLLMAALLAAAGGVSTAASAQVYPQGGFIKTQLVVISPGWHGDRYYDGHRYWARHDWERDHPPHRFDHRDHRDDHRDRRY